MKTPLILQRPRHIAECEVPTPAQALDIGRYIQQYENTLGFSPEGVHDIPDVEGVKMSVLFPRAQPPPEARA